MKNSYWTNIRRRLGNRTAIVVAGSVGFVLGAGGLVAANHDPGHVDDGTTTTVDTVDDSRPANSVDLTIPDVTSGPDNTTGTSGPDNTTDDTTGNTGPDNTTGTSGPDNTTDDTTGTSGPDNTTDDTTGTSGPDNTTDDTTGTSGPDNTTDDTTGTSGPDNTTDDTTGTSGPDNTTDDTTGPDNSVAARTLPERWLEARTYLSAGGSITVSWSGTSLSLDAISPGSGFRAEIEDNSGDRIRVDFEGPTHDHRIEVRLNHGAIRVDID